ncbi:MAG TPA: amino acid adenylation domain-containing protein, partial [Pyrinomonadaceae bacterium]
MSDLTKRIARLSPAQLEALRLRLKSEEAAPQTPAPAVAPRRRETNVSPQSFAQQRLWILNRLQPGNPAYNIPTPMRFVGRLDVTLLERVLTEIVRRHESLRTRFAADGGEPVQIVEPPCPVTLAVTDIGHLAEDEREAEVRRLANQDAQQPFDLSQAPLWRARVVRISERDQVLLLTMHHIITDAWSLSVLLREIVQLYKAFAAGRPSPLAELEIQYADYSVWQREWLRGEVLERQLAYWKQNLAGAPALLELPTDHRRPPVQTFNGARLSLNLGKPLSDALAEFNRREGVTLFVTLLAGFKALLHRYSGQADIVVGSPVANRKGAEVEKLIGFFVNTVAIRTKISGDPTFRDFLRQVRDAALGAISHQDVPFERVVEEVTPERNLSHSPLFQTVLALQNIRIEPWDLPGLQLHPIEVDSGHAKFDVSLSLMNSEQGISGRLEYNTDLFEGGTIRRMVEHLKELLGAAVAAPERRLRELSLLTGEERRLLAEWNNTAADFPRLCVHERIEQQAERSPEAVAVSHEGHSLTYAELNRRANRLAHFLRRQGVGAEVLVAILMERSLDTVVALLGVLKAGGAYVPLDAGYPAERLRYMVRDSGAGVVLTQAKLRRLLEREAEGGLRVVCVDEDEARAELASESDSRPESGVAPDNLAYVIYTSGSTGRPKGAMITHGALANHMYWIQEAHPLGASDAVLQKTPFSFDVSVLEFFWPLMVGARLVLAREQADLDYDYLTRLIDDRHITVVYFVASALQMFLSRRKGGSCRSLRYVFCGGEAMPLHVQSEFFQRFPATELRNIYGPTETTIDVTSWACEPVSRGLSVPIGRPIANTEIHLLDSALKPVPVGVAGELYIAGANLGRGYWRRPALTAEKFIPHPLSKDAGARLYRSGDLARRLSDGRIEFLGRIDHQVKVRGFRIELGEIDAALASNPHISECLTVLSGASAADKRIVSYIVPQGDDVTNSELRAYLRERLPEYMTPGAFVRLAELPRTPNGKIDRGGLPEPATADRDAAAPFAKPATDLEQTLAGLWREALKVEAVSLHDNFFDLGGHSLLLVQIHGQLQEKLGLEFSPIELFRHPTIGLLAGYLRGLGAPDGGGESPADEWLTQARERAAARRLGARAEGTEIAIIGMAGRFPGASSLEEFWEHLRDGVEAVRDLSDEEMLAAGMSEQMIRQERYVRKGCVLDGIELFDAEFFGMTPREAELMDPQQRLFLECAWEVMEDAGYDGSKYDQPIGVFAGAGTNSYMFQLYANRELFLSVGGLQTKLLNDKDFLSSRVSYRLGLKGPSLTVQTACSTSLVAVHLACQSLLNGECSMALAGGVSITVPQRAGYAYQEGGIISPDGHCRPFDARAAGTVGGSGAALLLLKPLGLALRDRDRVRAVIKGSAVN